ncbi:hypothetical protein GCM10010388_69240 [Streptomyces mauvecolor]
MSNATSDVSHGKPVPRSPHPRTASRAYAAAATRPAVAVAAALTASGRKALHTADDQLRSNH